MEMVTLEQYEQLEMFLKADTQQSINALKHQYKDRIGHELNKLNRALNRPLSERDDLDEIQQIIQRSLDKIERYINQ